MAAAWFALLSPVIAGSQVRGDRHQIDLSKPVPTKPEIIRAWQRRQDAVRSFEFTWTEKQTHARGWLPNPRYPEREWLSIAGLWKDRIYSIGKTLTVDGRMTRYTFDIDRPAEADGVDVKSPRGDTLGLGVHRHYTYVSIFDGQQGETRLTSSLGSPPGTIVHNTANIDAQNLDTRPILLTFRPLDPQMGHLLIDRAITNLRRSFYRGRSIFLLEERHDPSGWKTILWIDPERDFTVVRFIVDEEQRTIVDMDIDYRQDQRWGWIPTAWRVKEMLADGSMRLVSTATVSRYTINAGIPPQQFR
jgi:hypothetical protein